MVSSVGFKSATSRWIGERLPAAVKAFQVESARDLGTRIVRKTPVKTGLARGNWRLAIGNRVGAGVLRRKDQSGLNAIADIVSSASRIAAYSSFTLYNNVPYLPRLEDGYSQQAPLGMIRLSLKEFKANIPSVAKQAQKKLGNFVVR